MATLYARKGDSQALKPFIAAGVAGTQLLLSSVPDAASARSKGSNPFSTNSVSFTSLDGIVLTEPNTVSKLLGKN